MPLELRSSEYRRVHIWIERQLGTPSKCVRCSIPSRTTKYHWANISGEYKKDVNDWIRLCPSCHWKMDGRNAKYFYKEFCKHGHKMVLTNLFLRTRKYGSKDIECRQCLRNNSKRWAAKRREALCL